MTFECTRRLRDTLEAAFAELWTLCPLGPADVIVTAGAHVEKPGTYGEGLAFDLDALFWPDRPFVTRDFPTDAPFYLAVEAVLRRHWGTALAFNYNAGAGEGLLEDRRIGGHAAIAQARELAAVEKLARARSTT